MIKTKLKKTRSSFKKVKIKTESKIKYKTKFKLKLTSRKIFRLYCIDN